MEQPVWSFLKLNPISFSNLQKINFSNFCLIFLSHSENQNPTIEVLLKYFSRFFFLFFLNLDNEFYLWKFIIWLFLWHKRFLRCFDQKSIWSLLFFRVIGFECSGFGSHLCNKVFVFLCLLIMIHSNRQTKKCAPGLKERNYARNKMTD